MEKNVENQVEETKVEETGVETQATVNKDEGTQAEFDAKAEAQKMADAIVAKKLAKMPSKEELQKFNEWKEAQKTAEEKQAEETKRLVEKEQEANALKMENAILKKGVNTDDSDYVLFKVSKMLGEFEENLEKFLKENPKYLGVSGEPSKTTTGIKTQGAVSKEDGVTAILKQRHPELFN